ncbi:MAG TPA: SDR family NAD(P)-dependent oxidoreductase [Bacteroidales bacterium]|nr:SDR family NAD(P)-dependent oxidoreductase [Bacteroidales bacterium]HRZ50218.1 SDR family NAD(P)-dependent oxidoreductase [Bacteroidales bacterium]
MKKAIVVGATSGIGRGLAKILAQHDYLVGVTGRRTGLLEELKGEHPESYVVKSFDISDTALIANIMDELTAELGGLDLLVICAGTGDLNENLSFSIEEPTIHTNVLGFTAVADWAFNHFQGKKSGHLVAITSIGGLRGSRVSPAYNASKAYQINYLEGLRQKAWRKKLPVFITDIRPGLVDTNMAKGDGLFWVMPVEKASQQIWKAIQRKKRVAYVTRRWHLVALILKTLPKFLFDRM